MRLRDRLLVVLGVCLPVPVFAATGLSLPLPATVERMATELVPFVQPATLPEGGVAGGSIVLTDAERHEARAQSVVSQVIVAPAARKPPREGAPRRTEQPARGRPSRPRRDDTSSVPVEQPVTPDPTPVALPTVSPPRDDDATERHQSKAEHERKPKHERTQKAKNERESKAKEKPPKPEPKPKEEPKPPRHDPVEPKIGEPSPEKDNRPDGGKASEPSR